MRASGRDCGVQRKAWTDNAGSRKVYRVDLASGTFGISQLEELIDGSHTNYGVASGGNHGASIVKAQPRE
jgi:hypothetical protein